MPALQLGATFICRVGGAGQSMSYLIEIHGVTARSTRLLSQEPTGLHFLYARPISIKRLFRPIEGRIDDIISEIYKTVDKGGGLTASRQL